MGRGAQSGHKGVSGPPGIEGLTPTRTQFRVWGRSWAALGVPRASQDVSGELPEALWRRAGCREVASLAPYRAAQPVPRLHPRVHNTHIDFANARAWGLARCGHHAFADGGPARHVSTVPSPCLCGCAAPTLAHVVVECPAYHDLRVRWAAQVGLNPDSMPAWQTLAPYLFDPDLPPNTADSVRAHVNFLGLADARHRQRELLSPQVHLRRDLDSLRGP